MDIVTTSITKSKNIPKEPTLAEQAYHLLKSAIVAGELPAGTKIIETELAKRYGISRAPLREAIHRLEAHRLLEKKPHIGTRVVSLSVQQLVELYQIRANLEGLACRLTAEKPNNHAIVQTLEHILQIHANDDNFKAGNGYYLQEQDDDFHYCIIKNSGNALLASMLCDELYQIIRLYRVQFSKVKGRGQKAFAEHYHILDAIKNGDGELAEILMKRHIMASCHNICDNLNQHLVS